MNVSRSSPFIHNSRMLCWAFCFSLVSIYACQNLVSIVVHKFSSVWGTPPVTWFMSHRACSLTQSFTRGPLIYDKNVMLCWKGMASCSTCGFIPWYRRKLSRKDLLSSLSPWNPFGGFPPSFPASAGGPPVPVPPLPPPPPSPPPPPLPPPTGMALM